MSSYPEPKSYECVNGDKYIGKANPISRSSWERMVFRWCDLNPDVVAWNSEGVCIPYLLVGNKTSSIHKYYIDLVIKYKSGSVVLIEIKPKSQARPPKPTKGKTTKRLLEEAATWEKNQAKWKAAKAYAERSGYVFQVWTEDVLRALGMPIDASRSHRYSQKHK